MTMMNAQEWAHAVSSDKFCAEDVLDIVMKAFDRTFGAENKVRAVYLAELRNALEQGHFMGKVEVADEQLIEARDKAMDNHRLAQANVKRVQGEFDRAEANRKYAEDHGYNTLLKWETEAARLFRELTLLIELAQ